MFVKTVLLYVIVVMLQVLSATAATAAETAAEPEQDESASLVLDRIEREREAQNNRSVLLAHKRNYILPLNYTDDPNDDVFETGSSDFGENLDHVEMEFQLSLKAPIAEAVFTEQDALFFGFTVRAFWQAYNNDISAPFRETNYEPEIYWATPVPWKVLGGDASFVALGLSHQSNGRSQLFSRSWNRVYALLGWERWRYVFALKTWWRVPESEKDDPLDAEGDDNPDIEDYLGNFEFTTAYRRNDREIAVMLRNNLDSDDNRGALQVDWTFPMHRRFRGYVQYFNGYGDSLIDYDAYINRIGIGILLSDLL